MDDIATLANVSKPTVSRVLNDSPYVSAKTREHVLNVARTHGYAVNRNAKRLRQARAQAISVVLDFGAHGDGAIGDPFVYELLAGISEALSVRRQDLLLSPLGLIDAADFLHLYRSRAADGFILLGQGAQEPLLRDLAQAAIPFVVWGAVEQGKPYCAVGSDNRLGGRLAGERFTAVGAKRWLFVGNTDQMEIGLRAAGLRDAAAGDIVIDEMRLDSLAYSRIYQEASRYIAAYPRPDAVFAFSDTAAMAVIGAFREVGHTTPAHYALVGYNNIPSSGHFTPAITTIDQDTDVAGTLLVEKLMQTIDGATAISALLPTRLIVRET